MPKNGINIGCGSLEEIEEGASVNVGLLEVQVQLGTL
jgi:hypothetical protein